MSKCFVFRRATDEHVEVKTSVFVVSPHHGNILVLLLQSVFDSSSDVSQVRQRKLFKLDRPQNACVGIEHLQSLQKKTKEMYF